MIINLMFMEDMAYTQEQMTVTTVDPNLATISGPHYFYCNSITTDYTNFAIGDDPYFCGWSFSLWRTQW